jgi:hypothetical protein
MREARVAAVPTILKAPLLASQVPTDTLVPEKLNGEFTWNVTSGSVPGTFAGIAFWEVASETCQRFPEMVLACAVPTPAQTKAPARAVATIDFLIACLLV